MKYVLDTNIVIYLQNGLLIEPLPVAEYAISVITEMELLSYSGITESQALWLKRLIGDIQVIGLNDPIKEQTIRLRKERSLKLPDAIVCATAINEQAVLLTNDKKLHALDGLQSRALELRVR
jgi:predicted nucleic acid-binding protein